ncbi:MAG TPA: tRNA (adenosine(37)-N6)-threonylcarbamoyltransferase complex dimerization subunit type 1 TsaB [Acidobacteriaceae bacterium]|nr:tRNA (adenosine(37)-N6)-threonylcarbamoyltransferase complex dimerization subunit type 1 TsaB [Acidobacteriaceae bacterium]
MIVLAIDTCGSSGTLALGRLEADAVSVLAQTELPGKTYSAQLVPAIRAMLAAEGLDAATLDAVLAVNGPGSFTGIRVGVSAAKGFAEALSIPLAAVSRLAVLASKAGTQAAALDAGRSELYFREGERETLIASKDLASNPPIALAVCEPSVHWSFPDAILTTPPTAADALNYAAPRLLTGDFTDTASLDGNYVRRSDAEIFAKTSGKP